MNQIIRGKSNQNHLLLLNNMLTIIGHWSIIVYDNKKGGYRWKISIR